MNEPLCHSVTKIAHCLAVVKPPGQFTQGSWAPAGRDHPGNGGPTAISIRAIPARSIWASSTGSTGPTSGLLIWAKTPKAARRLSSQFERRRVVKEYWAIVESDEPATTAPGRCHDEDLDRLAHRADPTGVVQRGRPQHCRARARRSPRSDSRRPHLCRPGSPGCGSGPRPAGPTSCGCRRPGEECRSWAIHLRMRPMPSPLPQESRFTPARSRSSTPSPAAR